MSTAQFRAIIRHASTCSAGPERAYVGAMLAHLCDGEPVPVPSAYGVGETFANNVRARLVRLGAPDVRSCPSCGAYVSAPGLCAPCSRYGR